MQNPIDRKTGKQYSMHMEEKKDISSFTLKTVAAVTMLIDHLAYCFVPSDTLIFSVMRGIGRISFVIFAFLIIQGFLYTRNVRKYLLRLFVFALISEVPFDLAFHRTFFHIEDQNVFFTLALGLLAIILSEKLREHFEKPVKQTEYRKYAAAFWSIVPVLGCALTAGFIRSDYGAGGVLIIFAFYFFRTNTAGQLLSFMAVAFAFYGPSEWYGAAAFILFAFYQGRRGISRRYLFYAFYPVHLLIIGLIEYFMI